MDCDFHTTRCADGRYRHQCRRCGVVQVTKASKHYRTCGNSQAPRNLTGCRHLGEVLALEDCPTCSGQVKLKIYACELYGRAVLSGTVADYGNCSNCSRYEEGPHNVLSH